MITSVRFWIGIGITAAFLALLFLRFDLTEMWKSIVGANYLYVLPACLIYYVSLYLRAQRWSYVLSPFARIRATRLFPVVMVGYMANNMLPMRLGELARSYYLSTREPIRSSTALATIVIERVMDGITLLMFLVIGAFFLPVMGLTEQISDTTNISVPILITLVVAPFFTVLAMMIIAGLRPQFFLTLTRHLFALIPKQYHESVLSLEQRFLAGFRGLQQPRRLFTVMLMSIPIWVVEGSMYYLIALGFEIQTAFNNLAVMIIGMLLVTAISNLATAIPSSQGSVGPFEFFTALSLVFLGVSSGVASGYAVILHLALLLPVIGTGLFHLTINHLGVSDLTRRSTGEPEQGQS